MRLSEKFWKYPNRGLTKVQMGTIRHRTPAKPVLGGLLKPLFRQSHNGVLGSWPSALCFGDVEPSRTLGDPLHTRLVPATRGWLVLAGSGRAVLRWSAVGSTAGATLIESLALHGNVRRTAIDRPRQPRGVRRS